MSNLKIALADIPFHSVRIIESDATDELFNKYNLKGGKRHAHCRLASVAADCSFTFDLGSNYASKNTLSNYLLISRADLIDCDEVLLEGSADNSSWSTISNTTSFGSETLYGRGELDWIKTFNLTSGYRYHRVTYTKSSGTGLFQHSKVNIGKFFTFDAAPDFSYEEIEPESEGFRASSDALHFTRLDATRYRFNFTWRGQTDATVTSLSDGLVRYAEKTPVWLYTDAQHQILDSLRLVHAELVDYTASREWNGRNTITASFEELAG